MPKPTNIDAYIAGYPKDVQKLLTQVRATIKKAAPHAEELMSYGVAAFKLDKMLVWFGGFKNHIGLYPRGSGIEAFKKELSVYKCAKGSVQFPLDKPLPLDLITRIVTFRVKENMDKAVKKKAKSK